MFKKSSIALLIILLAALGLSSVRSVQGQADVVSPPHLILNVPAQHEVVQPNTTIQLTFDQPMDRASVESAFSAVPDIKGSFNWADDTTFTFTPDQALKRGETYIITINTTAKSKAGTPLDDRFHLMFEITANLGVNQVIPAPDATNVEAKTTLTVVFSKPVVPLVTSGDQSGLPQPLTITPAVDGTGEWVGTSIYEFHPKTTFTGGTKYTVTVSGDLKDTDGGQLDKAYSWSFHTIAPQILSISPSSGAAQIALDSNIEVTFNQPMDQASVRSAFSLRNATNGADVAGSFTFSDDGTSFTFKPASKLELSTQYQVTLLGSMRSAGGDATITNPTTVVFNTVSYPKVVTTTPLNNAQVAPGTGVNVIYSTMMDESTFIGKVHVDPKPDNLSINVYGTQLYINFESLPETTYTVTIDPGVADVYGNLVKDAFTLTFKTTDYPPQFFLAVRDTWAFTNAYNPDTTIQADTVNVSTINALLSSLNMSEVMGLITQNGGYPNLYQYKPPRVTRQWTEKLDVKSNVRSLTPIKLAGDQGGKLTPGIYYLESNSPDVNTLISPREPQRNLLIVATASLTIKVGPDDVLIWATDLKSGQPVPGAKIDIYNNQGKLLLSGTTDNNGLYQAKQDTSNDQPYYAVASGDGIFSFVASNWQVGYDIYGNRSPFPLEGETQVPYYYYSAPKQDVVYLYTDQPIYRPAHPVYFRGIVRHQDDVTFTVPTGESVLVSISDPKGKQVFTQTLPLNAYGAFSGKYDLPQDVNLGQYVLQVDYHDQTFSLTLEVAEFRPPEFQVNVATNSTRAAAGDTIHVNIDSSFFFGGPVSGANVQWVVTANQGYFNYLGVDDYDFYPLYGDFLRPYVYNRQVATGTGKLDDNGKLSFDVSADLGDNPTTQTFTIEATVTDVNNQPIAGRTDVTVYPSTVFIGLHPSAYVGQANKPMDVKTILVDWDNKPLAGQSVKVDAVEHQWQQDPKTLQWADNKTTVAESTLTTDESGKADFTFTPPHAGVYTIEATTRDPHERISNTTISVWVQGDEYVNWSQGDKSITLVADKKSYKPGDTANILIASPFPTPVQALITVERAGIMKTDVVTINGSYTYQLPIDVVHAPNVFVSAVLVQGSGDKGTPDVRIGTVNLDVFVTQQLKIKITPSTDKAKPGDTVKFDVLVTDLNDKPVAAEVGLSMADLANLSVGTDNSQKIFDFFWHTRSLYVVTGTPITRLIDDLTANDVQKQVQLQGQAKASNLAAPAPASGAASNAVNESGASDGIPGTAGRGGGGGGGGPEPTPRTNFVDTPLWLPDLTTDGSGHGTASVTLPDNLTTWRLNARGISQDTYVGDTTVDVVSTKPLLVRPSTPRFFVVGDETELAVVVNNNTDQDLSVQVGLDAKGVTLKADAKQTVNIPKSGRISVSWAATVNDVDNVDLSFSAVSGDYSDASKPDVGIGDQRLLPVYRYEAPDYVSTAGTLTQPGTRVEAVALPSATLAPTGDLTIRLNPSLAATTLDGLDYLKNYPYQCLEQTVSKFLPNVITFRALQKLHLDRPELRSDLEAAVKYAVDRLKNEQHGDGGWGWYYDEKSNGLTTAYALLGLTEAKASDFAIDQDMINRAIGFLQSPGQLAPITDNMAATDMNREAFIAYVLAKAQNPVPSVMDSLFQRREKMNLYARAFLAQAYGLSNGDQSKINTLLSDLQSAAIVSATGIHWEEKYWDYWNWDSDTRTTAIVLQTLVMFTPQSQLIPDVVRWLMVARRGDAWESTQETAWAVMALTNWMDASGELKANYTFNVTLNGTSIGSGTANAQTLRDTTTLQVDVSNMLRDQVNKVAVNHDDGPGSLYYTATLHVQQPVEQIKPTDRGFSFDRTYYVNGKAVTSAQVGDVITVVTEITANSDMYYVNINDPIPAGTEIVDTSLQTISQTQPQVPDQNGINGPDLEGIDVATRGWGWWWFTYTQLDTDKVVLSTSYLPAGTYRYVYQIRATSPGTYRVIPTNGQEFYFPEVFGRGAGSLFTVTP